MRIPVTVIDQIIHSVVSENGYHMVLTLEDVDAEKMTLGIPCSALPRLIDQSARALTDSERVLRRGWDPRSQLNVTWWNLNRDETEDHLILSLTFGSGGTLSFALPLCMASVLRDSLIASLENRPPSECGFGDRIKE